jgi:hypothetical protein
MFISCIVTKLNFYKKSGLNTCEQHYTQWLLRVNRIPLNTKLKQPSKEQTWVFFVISAPTNELSLHWNLLLLLLEPGSRRLEHHQVSWTNEVRRMVQLSCYWMVLSTWRRPFYDQLVPRLLRQSSCHNRPKTKSVVEQSRKLYYDHKMQQAWMDDI